jgi:hypothetical protein
VNPSVATFRNISCNMYGLTALTSVCGKAACPRVFHAAHAPLRLVA